MQDFRSFEVWKRAHAFVLDVYKQTDTFPHDEGFGLTLQLCRVATSTATRIAEGCGKDTNAEFAADLRKAKTTATELEYLLLVAKDLGYLKSREYTKLSEDVIALRKMILAALRKM
jgi:four helix bundle protein